MFSRLIHVVACIRISFINFIKAEYYLIVCLYHIFYSFTHWLHDTTLSAVVNNAAMNISVLSDFKGINLEVKLLDHIVIPLLSY